MPGISSLTGTISDSVRWSASNNITAQQALQQGDNVATSYNFGTAAVNAAVSGADELISFLQTIAAGGSATINLQSITNILQQSGIALARLKGYKIRLLKTSGQGAVDSVNGTACSSITVGGGSNPTTLNLNGAGTFTVNSGGSQQYFDPTAAGFTLVSPTTKNLLIANNDGSVAAAVQVTLIGATT